MLSRSSTFFSVFPPPALLNVHCAGLHIADDTIRAVVLSQNNVVTAYGERPLPKGLVEGGTISNENLLAQEIKALKEKLKLSLVRVSLPEERMYLFSIEMPGVSDLGIKDIVESKLEENIPIPPSEVIYEFDPSERKKNLITKASVSAFPEKLIQSYVSCCTLAGLDVQGFDTEPRSVIRSLALPKEVCLVVDISLLSTSMFVVADSVAQFSSTISLDDIKKVNVLQDEIKKVIEYWNTHGEGKEIKKIYMLGSLAKTEGLIESLEQTLKIDIVLGDVWAGLANKDRVPPIEFTQALNYGVAIGLAIHE